ncbi:MAG: sialate O-acetylesterase, partial [Gemmataceae bacterium]
VWGSADPGESVSVSFAATKGNAAAAASASVSTGKNGKWRIEIQVAPEMAGGPYTLTIKGNNTITLKDVYVGEVWICSGQSNMEFHLSSAHNAKEAIAKAKNPKIRLFTVPRNTSDKPLTGFKEQPKWQECNADTAKNFTAVGYFFGRDLQKALNVPIGLIHTSWGGTRAEAWATRAALEKNPELKDMIEQYNKDRVSASANYQKTLKQYEADLAKHKKAVAKAKEEGKQPPRPPRRPFSPDDNPHRPAVLYNAMIHPLQPYAIKGAIWYQGESNAGRAYQYRTLFPTMIQSWRTSWKEGDFPFLFVQLAPWIEKRDKSDQTWAELREAQLLTTTKLKHTGMAVITDVGDAKDIHPRKKEPVGARLALAARAIAYGEKIEYSGPIYKSMTVEGDKAVLSFTHMGKGLEVKGESLQGFTVAGEDHAFHPAQAEIKGDKVVVRSEKVAKPVAVRYGWSNNPVVNLWNKDGLPASPFRTDDFPGVTAPKP